MLEIQCEKCARRFFVEGYTTADSWTDPGEVVTELKSEEPLCECLEAGGAFAVVDESHRTFEDDVI